MDYEKKYKDALAKAREIHRNEVEKRFDMEWLFPELKESEDERIRKALIEMVHDTTGDELWVDYNVHKEEALAWLEKQGESYTKKDVDDAYLKGISDAKNELEKQGERKPLDYERANIQQKDFASVGETATIELSSPIDCGDRIYHVSHKPIEKNGEQKPFDYEHATITQNDFALKVEPKFKIGDWINGYYTNYKVTAINSKGYAVEDTDGSKMNILFENEKFHHLWTIADVKEGDILAGKIDGDNYILIFKTIKDGWIETYGHYYNAVNRFCVPSQLFCRSYQGTFTPATKEQRDTLMKAMTDAGYQWDDEKKELKKVEQKLVDKVVLFDKYEGLTDFERALADICIGWIDEELGWKQYIKDNADVLLKIAIKKFNSIQDAPFEQKPADKNATTKQDGWLEIPFGAKDSELQEVTYYIPKGFHAEIEDDKVVIKKGEQKPAWTEEDEDRVEDTIYFLDTAKKHYAITIELDACIDWLKSLKERIGG